MHSTWLVWHKLKIVYSLQKKIQTTQKYFLQIIPTSQTFFSDMILNEMCKTKVFFPVPNIDIHCVQVYLCHICLFPFFISEYKKICISMHFSEKKTVRKSQYLSCFLKAKILHEKKEFLDLPVFVAIFESMW